MKYIVSDTHFFHKNIIKFMNRPYKDMSDMVDSMVDEWNHIVKEGDTVYHLGDFCLGDNQEQIRDLLRTLNGNITLVVGNHDTPNKLKLYSEFSNIKVTGGFNLDGYLFTHFPVHPSLLEEITTRTGGIADTYNICGHKHRGTIDDPRYFNMCWDVLPEGQHILPFSDVKKRIINACLNRKELI